MYLTARFPKSLFSTSVCPARTACHWLAGFESSTRAWASSCSPRRPMWWTGLWDWRWARTITSPSPLTAMVSSKARIATAIARDDARVLVLSRDSIQRLARFYSHIAFQLYRNLSAILGIRFASKVAGPSPELLIRGEATSRCRGAANEALTQTPFATSARLSLVRFAPWRRNCQEDVSMEHDDPELDWLKGVI